jgi:response regulator RpfG family c-di-GMP phosphodiesterase
MAERETAKATRLRGAIMEAAADLAEGRDGIAGGHVSRTAKWPELLPGGLGDTGIRAGQPRDRDQGLFSQSARPRDPGKIVIGDAILKKPGPLTAAELEAMRGRAVVGADIIDKICGTMSNDHHHFLDHARTLAPARHEKRDGSGCPHCLPGPGTPPRGRLTAAADVRDAPVSRRPRKEPTSRDQAAGDVEGESGRHFGPKLVEAFREVKEKYKT